jgi:uncharacterized membrane protein YgdD (TMEM256/DUF423 family)
MIHGIGLILIGILYERHPCRRLCIAAGTMFTGIILFSGSLYLLTLTDTRWLGMITPFGGLSFLIAWLMLALNFTGKNRARNKNRH